MLKHQCNTHQLHQLFYVYSIKHSLKWTLATLFVMLRQSQPCTYLPIATLLELYGLAVVGTLESIDGKFNLRPI